MIIRHFSRWTVETVPEVTSIVIAMAAAAAVVVLVAERFRRLGSTTRWRVAIAVLIGYGMLLAVTPESPLLSNLAVLTTAAVAGTLIGTSIRRRETLVTFAIAASLADLVSYLFGPTAFLLNRAGDGWGILNFLMVSIPLAGRIVPIVGIGDLLFMGAYSLALRALGDRPIPAFLAPLAGLLVAVGVGLSVGGAPALPFISATTVAWALRRRPPAVG